MYALGTWMDWEAQKALNVKEVYKYIASKRTKLHVKCAATSIVKALNVQEPDLQYVQKGGCTPVECVCSEATSSSIVADELTMRGRAGKPAWRPLGVRPNSTRRPDDVGDVRPSVGDAPAKGRDLTDPSVSSTD